jgi:carboxyl-terminal processing protease
LKTAIVTVSTLLVCLLLMGAMFDTTGSDEGAYRQLQVYTEVLQRIKSEYVEEPDLKSVTVGAVTGLLEALDPFASYLDAEQYKEYLKSKGTQKGDVGLVLSRRPGTVSVVDSIAGSPADKAGIVTGDLIESIRGIGTRDMPLAYAELLLQGKPGTTIELSLLSLRNPEPKSITLTRAAIQYPRVSEKLLDDQIGHIQVRAMMPGTAAEVGNAVRSLEKQGAKKLLLDLRHCAAGTPEEGIAVADVFLEKGLISYLVGQKMPRRNFEATPPTTSLPLVVLTNRGTATGAEVAAAALLDNKRAEVVGERTYGDASVRQPIPMDPGGAIIISVAKYYSPGGKAIQDNAVTPTHPVAEIEPIVTEEDEEAVEPEPRAPGQDPILNKGIEVLGGKVQAASPKPERRTNEELPPRRFPPNQVRPEP